MTDVIETIENTDDIIKKQEDELIRKINAAYMNAVKSAQNEFKDLESLKQDVKITSDEVRNIVKKTLDVFEKEYLDLVKPIAKASKLSYTLGLRETAQFIKAIREKK